MITFADFCAGIGGFRLGLEALGWECSYSCEIDSRCEKTYRANFNTQFDTKDIFKVETESLPYFDVLCAGFPCQPFSIAGKRLGFSDPRGKIIFQLLKIISLRRPPVVILENVANFVTYDKGAVFSFLGKHLSLDGYKVRHQILDSADFGVPQNRKRIFIVAVLAEAENVLLNITKKRTEAVPFRNFIARGDASIPISKKWEYYIDLYTGRISVEDIDFSLPKTRVSLERVSKGTNLEDCIFQMRSSGIRAYSVDAPLPTFAVSNSGGGAMIPVYSSERRHLSLTEMKRIMGFPDSFKFDVSRTDAIKQLANAVCPPVVTSLGRDLQPFFEHNSRSLEITPV